MSNEQEPKTETEEERLARLLAADKHVDEAERLKTVEAKGLDVAPSTPAPEAPPIAIADDEHLQARLAVARDALRSTLDDIDAAEAKLKDLQAHIADVNDHLGVVGEEHKKLLAMHARELAEAAVDREKWRAELEGYFGKKVGLQAEHETLQRTLLHKSAIINAMIVSTTEEKSDAPG